MSFSDTAEIQQKQLRSIVYIRIPASIPCALLKVITSHGLVQCVLLTPLVSIETAVLQFIVQKVVMFVFLPLIPPPSSLFRAIITPSPLWKIAAVVFKLCLITSNTPGTKSRGHPQGPKNYIYPRDSENQQQAWRTVPRKGDKRKCSS